MERDKIGLKPPDWRRATLLVFGAAGCFHLAYTPASPGVFACFIVGYVCGLVQLARLTTPRKCFYAGLITGLLCAGPQLECFWRIFGPGAMALWLVLAFWTAAFVALSHLALARFGAPRAVWLIPFLWTGLEYFRSELYYLKFSWLNVGFAFAGGNRAVFHALGMYGTGFAAAVFAVLTLRLRGVRLFYLLPLAVFFLCLTRQIRGVDAGNRQVEIGGVQMEFPTGDQIQHALDKITTAQTNLDAVVLSEYTLDGPPSQQFKNWCRDHRKFLIVGGKDPAAKDDFYDTAFVISTNGEIVFKQAKAVPVQFFKDGLPAREQKVWESPWGKIGICICYDLSYSRVTDELIRQGAQLLVVPTMDVVDWGRHEHELHARVAPVRAAEYGIPIFRVASSGISQGVERTGRVQSTASFPGENEMIIFSANLNRTGTLPPDRYLVQIAILATIAFVIWLAITALRQRQLRTSK